jgi:hypothetical protein
MKLLAFMIIVAGSLAMMTGQAVAHTNVVVLTAKCEFGEYHVTVTVTNQSQHDEVATLSGTYTAQLPIKAGASESRTFIVPVISGLTEVTVQADGVWSDGFKESGVKASVKLPGPCVTPTTTTQPTPTTTTLPPRQSTPKPPPEVVVAPPKYTG